MITVVLAMTLELCSMDPNGYLVIRGRRTWFHADKQWGPTATGRKTSSGMIVGQIVQPFSGAYSGEYSWTFIHSKGKTYVADYSEPFKTVGGSVCLAPRPVSQALHHVNGEARLFQNGRFQMIGPAYKITEFDGSSVRGYYLADSRGQLASFFVMEPSQNNVYAQWFSWSKGKRRLVEKTLLRINDGVPVWP